MVKQWSAALALAVLACLAGAARAEEKKPGPGPEPGAKAAQKWEYAELHFSATSTWAIRGGMAGPGGGAGGGGGGGRAVPARAATTVRWITADGETESENWEALATKLKAPAAAKGAKPDAHRVKLLNHLGAQGWELVSSTTTVMTFKRKAAR